MKIYLNSKWVELKSSNTIAEILKELNIKPDGIAVAVDYQIVSKNNYEKTKINDGDKIEIVQAVQGG